VHLDLLRVNYLFRYSSEGVHHLYKELDVQASLSLKHCEANCWRFFPTARYSVTTSVTTSYRDHLRHVCTYSLPSCCNHHDFQWHQTNYCDYLRHVESCSLPSSCKSSTLQWQTISGIIFIMDLN